jgi:S1-C subfamily serine protease
LLLCLVGVVGLPAYFLLWKSKPDAALQKAEDQQARADRKDPGNRNEDQKNKNEDPNPNPKKNPDPLPVVDPNAGKPLPDQIPPELVPRIKQATAYLRVTMPSGQVAEGSGFFAMEPGIVVTNAHVLGMLQAKSQVPRNVQVVVNSGQANEKQIIGTVLGVDRASDLAVVRVNDNNLPAPLILETQRKLMETQKVYICGFPFGATLGKDITISDSTISALRNEPGTGILERVQVNGGMHPGNSGGPVVNSFGNVIGVSVAVIRGTQINYAVPAEKVRLIMEGRLADAKHGEAFVQAGQTRLPVTYTCLDPLNRIRDMRVEVWTGQPGPARPYSLQKPQPLPNDGPRQSHVIPYQNNAGNLEVPLPQLAPGSVCWLQPVVTTKTGATFWGPAQATPVSLIPLERKPANLLVSLSAQKERTVSVKSAWTVTLLKGKEKKVVAEKLDASILEVLSPDPKGAAISASIGSFNVSAEEDARRILLNPQVPMIMKQIPPLFTVDATNKIRTRVDRNLNPKMDLLLRNQVEDTYTQLCNSLEAVTLPMPNRLFQPKEQWSSEVPMMLRAGKFPEVVDLALACTFEGIRQRNQRSEGLIAVAGNVKGRGLNAKNIGGDIAGKIAFDLTGGFIAQAQLTISTEQEILGGALQALYAFDVTLDRQPGNVQNIPPPPEYKPGPEIAKGKILFNVNGFLAPTDPLEPPQFLRNPNSRKKVHPVKLEAGKTYVISLNSNAFDSYLRLEDPSGKTIAEDDDGGGFPNALITHRCTQSGVHRVIATSFDGKTGPYQLMVQEADGPKVNPKVGENPLKGGSFTKPGKSAAPTNYMKLVSSKGDFIGQGKNYDYRGDELVVKRTPRGVNVSVDGWTLEVGAPNGQFLQVREYQGAKRFAFSGDSPGLDFSGKGRGSNRLAGEFVVWELELDGDRVVRLAIDFIQRSEERGPPLYGRIRINSSLQ